LNPDRRERVVVVGAGQAGLAVSHELAVRGVQHVVLERGRVGSTWRARWESFCLVTPNWSVQLPGGTYDGSEPDGYLPRDDIVRCLERYARSFSAPVREGVAVRRLERADDGFLLRTSEGDMAAEIVILATGAYQRPHRPAAASAIPPGVYVIDAERYRSPEALPAGKVLVVGSGQTGCQLAEELADAGREVFLACGRAPWTPRRIGGRDVVHWLQDTGFFDHTRAQLPSPQARLLANIQATGHGGGHDLHFRTLRGRGVTLLGRLVGAEGRHLGFADDVTQSVAFGDARYAEFRTLIRETCARRAVAVPDMPEPDPFDARCPTSLELDGLGAVLFTSGFRPDYSSWVHIPGTFDDLGFPVERDGASSVAPGLYFCGVHFMRKRKSSLLIGVGEDAALVASAVAS